MATRRVSFDAASFAFFPDEASENKAGKGEAGGKPATPSPLSQWGQFPTFTGVRVAHRATPAEVAP